MTFGNNWGGRGLLHLKSAGPVVPHTSKNKIVPVCNSKKSVLGCLWETAASLGLRGCSIWWGFGNVGPEECEGSTTRSWAGLMGGLHETSALKEKKSSGLLWAPSSHGLGSLILLCLEQIPAEDQHGLRRSFLPKLCPQRPGRWEGFSRVHSHGWESWFPVPGLFFYLLKRWAEKCVSAFMSSSVPEAEQQHAFCFSHCCPCLLQAHMGTIRSVFMLIMLWAELTKFFIKMCLSCRWENGRYFRQAVREQCSAVSKNQTAKQ